jgi:hypothetical protein
MMDIETPVYYVHLTRLIAREDFIEVYDFKYYEKNAQKISVSCNETGSVKLRI